MLKQFGIAAVPPRGWDVRIARRADGARGEISRPVLHACTIALPEDRGDYGSGVVELLGQSDVFVSLLEFGPESIGTALFARQGRPRPLPIGSFSPSRLQRTLPGQSGLQSFFTEDGRPFCLYVVLGSHVRRRALLPLADQFVDSLTIDRPVTPATSSGGPR